MRLGIRSKLVGTLILAGLLPLAVALGSALFFVNKARNRFAGLSYSMVARQQARHISTLLTAQIDFIRAIDELPGTESLLEQSIKQATLNAAQIEESRRQWREAGPGDPLRKAVLENLAARRWQVIRRSHPYITEVLITDRSGRVVAATDAAVDYFQGDKAWWQTWAKEPSQALIEAHIHGAGGKSGIDIDVPIEIGEGPGTQGQIAGVVKISLESEWLVRQMHIDSPGEAMDPARSVWLVGGDGEVILGSGPAPLKAPLSAKIIERLGRHKDGYLIGSGMPDHEIVGYAQVALPGRERSRELGWHILATAREDALATTTHTILLLLAGIGVVFIVVFFFAGVWIGRREIIRPIRRLEGGARELEAGNYAFRLKTYGEQGSVFRDDELGRLSQAFNRMAAQLQRSVSELAHANTVKQQFIDIASHELRTPVTYLMGAAELAQRQRSDSPLLQKIATKAQRLSRIVDNMFKLLRGGNAASTLRLGEVDLNHLAATAASEVDPFLRARRQTLHVEIGADVKPIYADGDKLLDILGNLLSNAIRFSQDGTKITLEIVDRGEEVDLIVSDPGGGIPPEQMDRLFEPFSVAGVEPEHHTSGEYQYMSRGIGLGMSVVKRFVEMHDGSVRVDTSDQGTRVCVTLPRREVPAEAMAPSRAEDFSI